MTSTALNAACGPRTTYIGEKAEMGVENKHGPVAEQLGYEVMGPIYAEFCLRLWSLEAMIEDPEKTALLFCARGGLRMQLGYERFLVATSLRSNVRVASLMVSRAVAIRGSLLRVIREDLPELLPVAATVVGYEFSQETVRGAVSALAGIDLDGIDAAWEIPCTPAGLLALLRHADGRPAVAALADQEALFAQHLAEALEGRPRGILVDTGFYGTTRELIAEGHPNLDFGSVMIARSFRPGYPRRGSRTVGLLVEAAAYSPFRRRTALLRYWHFVEWLFEPELPSVRSFRNEDGNVKSNLEVPGWRARVNPSPGTAFYGLLHYLDQLPGPPAARVVGDADRAWTRLRRAIIWPDRRAALALAVGSRTHDFGRQGSWTARPWRGPLTVLRGSAMWREGEIALAGTPLRLPLLSVIEAAYAFRHLWRRAYRLRGGDQSNGG